MIDGPFGVGTMSNLGARIFYTTYLFAAPSTYQSEAIVTMPSGGQYRYRDAGSGVFVSSRLPMAPDQGDT